MIFAHGMPLLAHRLCHMIELCVGFDLFYPLITKEATEEVSLDSPEREPILSDGPSPAITPVTPTGIITPTVECFGSLDEVMHSAVNKMVL